MVPKKLVPALFAAVLLACGSASAAEYRGDDVLTLDLSKAVFSKTPVGPPARFAPLPVEAKGGSEPAWARNDLKVEPKQVRTVRAAPAHRTHVASDRPTHVAAARPHGTARARLAHRHYRDPLNAQAMDTRIQTWPCRSGGGICDWKR